MNGGILGNILKEASEPSVLGGLLNYRSAGKELKGAINNRLYEESPELFMQESTGRALGEGGSDTIPRIHVDDLKQYFGDTSIIPSRYKRTTGKRDIDELAAFANHDDIDQFVESIQSELTSRSSARESKKLLSERRNDPGFIQEMKDILEKEKSYYAPEPEAFQPSEKDMQWYMKNVVIPKETPKRTGMENFKINRNDIDDFEVPSVAVNYLPSIQRVAVSSPAAPQPKPVPVQRPAVLPLKQSQPVQPREDPQSWAGSLANILSLQTTVREQQ